MISTALVIVTAAMAMQTSDTTRAARESFAHCLRAFVDHSTSAHKTLAQFNTEYPQACAAEQAAFRQAIIQRDMGSRSTRASAEDAANLEVEDARANFNDIFQMSLPPDQVAHAAAPAPATPAPAPAAGAAAPTVAAQPASQTTGAALPPAQPH